MLETIDLMRVEFIMKDIEIIKKEYEITINEITIKKKKKNKCKKIDQFNSNTLISS